MVWDVSPILVDLGILQIRWYGALFATGVYCAYVLAKKLYRQEGRRESDVSIMLNYVVVGVLLGARLGHCLFYEPGYYLSNPLRMLMIWEGGLASHGALVGTLIAVYLYQKRVKDQAMLYILDRVAIGVTLAGAFIRIGNLMNQEIIGKPTSVPWAFIFPRWDQVPRHPTQIYEALFCLLLLGLMLKIYKPMRAKMPHGLMFGIFLSGIFGFRFLVEFLKETQVDFEKSLVLNMGQLLSIVPALLGVYFIRRALATKNPTKNLTKKRPAPIR